MGAPADAARRMRVVVCAIALTQVIPVHAEGGATYHFFSAGYGRRTCYDYLAASSGADPSKFDRKLVDQHTYLSENAAFDQWIYGYFTAMNFDSAVGGNKRGNIEAQTPEIIAWTREWCRTRPNAVVFEAVRQFVNDRWALLRSGAAPANPATAPAAAATDAMFVYVTFQDDVSSDDKNAFLQAYSVFIADGPDASGVYKLRLSGPLPQDQLEQVLASMRSQAKVVKSAAAS